MAASSGRGGGQGTVSGLRTGFGGSGFGAGSNRVSRFGSGCGSGFSVGGGGVQIGIGVGVGTTLITGGSGKYARSRSPMSSGLIPSLRRRIDVKYSALLVGNHSLRMRPRSVLKTAPRGTANSARNLEMEVLLDRTGRGGGDGAGRRGGASVPFLPNLGMSSRRRTRTPRSCGRRCDDFARVWAVTAAAAGARPAAVMALPGAEGEEMASLRRPARHVAGLLSEQPWLAIAWIGLGGLGGG